jgi:hypothetical protein
LSCFLCFQEQSLCLCHSQKDPVQHGKHAYASYGFRTKVLVFVIVKKIRGTVKLPQYGKQTMNNPNDGGPGVKLAFDISLTI